MIPKKTYTPIGCLVAVHLYPMDESPGGLVMPETSRNPYATQRALVVAIGPDCKYVKEGDEVLLGNVPQCVGIMHMGHKTGLLREENISGVINRPTEKDNVKERCFAEWPNE